MEVIRFTGSWNPRRVEPWEGQEYEISGTTGTRDLKFFQDFLIVSHLCCFLHVGFILFHCRPAGSTWQDIWLLTAPVLHFMASTLERDFFLSFSSKILEKDSDWHILAQDQWPRV